MVVVVVAGLDLVPLTVTNLQMLLNVKAEDPGSFDYTSS